MNQWTSKSSSALLATGVLLLAVSCRAGIDAKSVAGKPLDTPIDPYEWRTRIFDVTSLQGLQEDAAHSGLGLGLTIPRESSTLERYELGVSFRLSESEAPIQLKFDSALPALERPVSLHIPRAALPLTSDSSSLSLTIRDAQGVSRILAPQTLVSSDDGITVTTTQPMGLWSLSSLATSQSQANYLLITVSGLSADESLRYEVLFTDQSLVDSGYDIDLPPSSFKQKTTGNEVRTVAAPTAMKARYKLTLLEAPVKSDCQILPAEEGLVRGQLSVTINCQAR